MLWGTISIQTVTATLFLPSKGLSLDLELTDSSYTGITNVHCGTSFLTELWGSKLRTLRTLPTEPYSLPGPIRNKNLSHVTSSS